MLPPHSPPPIGSRKPHPPPVPYSKEPNLHRPLTSFPRPPTSFPHTPTSFPRRRESSDLRPPRIQLKRTECLRCCVSLGYAPYRPLASTAYTQPTFVRLRTTTRSSSSLGGCFNAPVYRRLIAYFPLIRATISIQRRNLNSHLSPVACGVRIQVRDSILSTLIPSATAIFQTAPYLPRAPK